jgi:hypothetical protein
MIHSEPTSGPVLDVDSDSSRLYVGHTDMAGIVEPKNKQKLANNLLTFAINGMWDSYCVIVV